MCENACGQIPKPNSAPGQCQTGPSRRILVVDDEVCIRVLMTKVLADSGYEVDAAEDGAAAWQALQAKSYDLLITDHNMPRLTGLDLIKNVRSARMDLPVVMVAGELPERDLDRNPSLNLAATLLKPFALDALMEIVRNALCGAIPLASP